MAHVIVRVELHAASWSEYDVLHERMEALGFSRLVQADDSTWYQLPLGTYVHSHVLGSTDARDRAVAASNATGRAAAIFVSGWDGNWSSSGLPPA